MVPGVGMQMKPLRHPFQTISQDVGWLFLELFNDTSKTILLYRVKRLDYYGGCTWTGVEWITSGYCNGVLNTFSPSD